MVETKHSGSLEYNRFADRREPYRQNVEKMKGLGYEFEEFLEHFPSFIGHMSLSRFLGLYELYKQTLGVAGHIADIGIYKGASFFFFAKLVKIFEGESLTQVHGFDWFEGAGEDDIPNQVELGSYKESYERFMELYDTQGVSHLALVHKMDVTKEMKPFLDKYRHLQFKLIFLDAGMYNIVKAILPLLWERLTPGGIIVFDQFNHELSPGETIAVREILPDQKVRTLPNIWMPTGYIVKE